MVIKFQFVEKLILIIAPLVALAGMLVPVLFDMINFTLLGMYLAIPMIIAPALFWHYFNHKLVDDANELRGE